MRKILFALFLTTLSAMPALAQNNNPINRCFEGVDATTPPQGVVDCLREDYEDRDMIRQQIEGELTEKIRDNTNGTTHAQALNDVKNFETSVEMFERYRNRECSNQETFRRDKPNEGLYSKYVCMYKMTSHRIDMMIDLMK